ncbi:hypothetical protein [Phytohabitans houttuyneae]|uniref:Uncharacterized protein n=1 Tax=Phytohabitans houttuyneae TaxID=1076126 RepID=A0A6V8KT52_9ACTN|nr:hypothetical protein [Phytohabitans houttuyneae]GFJ83775.1 hypothetical protein Phou_079550 [Phytohabitans houttuyneae]
MTLATRQDSPRAVISRWDPFRDLEDMYERVGQLMDGLAEPGRAMPAPLADLEETDVRVGKSNAGRPRRIEIKDS